MSKLRVTKRDGSLEDLNLEKWHRVVAWACQGLTGVNISELELRSNVQFHDKIKTSDIMELTIKAAADMISEESPNYQYVASRLVNYHLRKTIYGDKEPVRLYDHVLDVVDLGFYDKALLEMYTEEEWDVIDTYVDHKRDFQIPYVGMEQMRGKYLVKNRVTGRIYETPQMAYILISAVVFSRYPKEKRLKYVKEYYDAISGFSISLPTPIMAGVRTPTRQYASCVLVETDDSLDSINATASAIVKYASKRAGLGIGAGRIRAVGSPIRNGDTTHTGITNFIKYFQAAVKSCNQGGIRSASATLSYPWWHYEIEDLIVLKNNKGIDDNRARHLDYSVQMNRLFYERVIEGKNVSVFSPKDVPEMYEAFFMDQERFKELYLAAEANPKIRKKTFSALDLFSGIIQERKDTGRIYISNVDHMNDHGSFTVPIRMSNLCQEITEPTIPLENILDEDGEIATCILSAINFGKITEPSDFQKPAELIVRALDEIIDLQEYPVPAAERPAKGYRFLGVGIINFAYWLAKNGLTYQFADEETLGKVHEYAEAWSYYLIKASVDLAKEKGACDRIAKTKYGQGVLPIDTYKKDVDVLVKPYYGMDWESLRKELKTYGIRNSTLMAIMPAETSAAISNSTNGIEPARSLVSVKQSKDGVLKQVVPDIRRLKKDYDLLWDQKSPEGYLQICAVLQKFMDQAISVNTSYNPAFYEDGKVPLSTLMIDILNFYRYGGKNLYYLNTNDGAGELDIKPEKVVEEEHDESEADCEACKL